MWGRSSVLIMVAGCGFRLSVSPGQDGSVVDSDAPGLEEDADLGQLCATWDAQHFVACQIAMPAPTIDLGEAGSPYTYDTTVAGGELRDRTNTLLYQSNVTLEQSDQTIVALANVEGFRVGANVLLYVVGDKPLLVASWSEIDVAGTIDAGSHGEETNAMSNLWTTTHLGAGANVACATYAGSAGTNALSSGGSGGGGGGAFGGNGGGGAGGDVCANGCPRAGGAGGQKLANAPTVIRGGCPGGSSGTAGSGANSPSMASTFSAGGGGGGALELSARTQITISGRLLAGGAGGGGAPRGSAAGGGGGGSGGYLGLDAKSVVVTGVVAATGAGGGGSGPFSDQPQRGYPGADGAAAGGAGGDGGSLHGTSGQTPCGVSGANGGGGSVDGVTATAMDACGGGGGGGGAGFVMVFASSFDGSSGTFSPAPVK